MKHWKVKHNKSEVVVRADRFVDGGPCFGLEFFVDVTEDKCETVAKFMNWDYFIEVEANDSLLGDALKVYGESNVKRPPGRTDSQDA